jgi:hypothetical protein
MVFNSLQDQDLGTSLKYEGNLTIHGEVTGGP